MNVLFQNHWVAMETSNLCTKAPAIFHPTTGFLHYSAYATRKNRCAKIPPGGSLLGPSPGYAIA